MKRLFLIILAALFCKVCLPQGSNEPVTYLVQPKNTLYSISRTFNVSVEDLRRWNRLPSNDITIGQLLTVGFKQSNQAEQPQQPRQTTPAEPPKTEPARTAQYPKETIRRDELEQEVIQEEPAKNEQEDIRAEEITEKKTAPAPEKAPAVEEEQPGESSETGIEPCLLGKWTSKQECDIFLANPNFYELNQDGTGKFGLVDCVDPYPQHIYSFKYRVSGKTLELSEQKKLFGPKEADYSKKEDLFFRCLEDAIMINGVKYSKK